MKNGNYDSVKGSPRLRDGKVRGHDLTTNMEELR